MTEAEWLASNDPVQMIMLMNRKIHNRKSRLAGCGICRYVWDHLDSAERHVVEVAERFADNLASRSELAAARKQIRISSPASDVSLLSGQGMRTASVMKEVVVAVYGMIVDPLRQDREAFDRERPYRAVRRDQSALIRCVFGNPFSPVTVLPEWRTSTVIPLAQQMYDSRDFSAMPILADALQDADCSDEAVLTHCRGPGPHVRGCFVVDACLGKS